MLFAAEQTPPPTDTAPTLPAELIGTVVIALITGVVTIVVAIIQRNKGGATPAPTTGAPIAIPFAIPEKEWEETRRRALAAEADVKHLAKDFYRHVEDYDGHVESAEEKLSKLRERVARAEGQLGIS